MQSLADWITTISDDWWVHLVVLVLSCLDGFFPTVPSESVLVSLGSLWSSSGHPNIVLLILAGWAGACAGDNLAYLIGRRVGWQRFRYFREGKGHRAVLAADRGLRRRALLFLMTARYIPFGRTAVNLVAGAVRYPHRKFLHRDLLSTGTWAVYSVGIGALAGQWFEHNHLLGVGVALVVAVVLSLVVERVVNAVHARLDRRADAREAARADAREAARADAAETAGAETAGSRAATIQDTVPDVERAPDPAPASGTHRAPDTDHDPEQETSPVA